MWNEKRTWMLWNNQHTKHCWRKVDWLGKLFFCTDTTRHCFLRKKQIDVEDIIKQLWKRNYPGQLFFLTYFVERRNNNKVVRVNSWTYFFCIFSYCFVVCEYHPFGPWRIHSTWTGHEQQLIHFVPLFDYPLCKYGWARVNSNALYMSHDAFKYLWK